MYEHEYMTDVSRKLDSDNLRGVVIAKDGTELYANIDAGNIYEALAYIDESNSIIKYYKNNPENPKAKRDVGKAGLLVYKAVRLVYDDDEYAKIKKMNLTTRGLTVLVQEAINLFNKREQKDAERKN